MKILLVGVGGYGAGYVTSLLNCTDPSVVFEGAVDPYFLASPKKQAIEDAGIPVYDTMEEFYRLHNADLAIICTPPFLHREQSIYALSHGSYVLCEKPIAPTLEEAEEMMRAEEKYGKWIAIGFQWSFIEAMRDLKADILSGVLGKPISFKIATSWPRGLSYYSKERGWNGRIAKDGITILDSIASNACAHFLHNMLFLVGEGMDECADAEQLSVECYRANDIETFDTCSVKMTAKGVPMYLIASHAAEKRKDPEFLYLFENAEVRYSQSEGTDIIATFKDGTVKNYGDPFRDRYVAVWHCIDDIRGGSVPICTVKAAMPHIRLVKRIYDTATVKEFPSELIGFNEAERRVFIKGLYDLMYRAYDKTAMLSEMLFSICG